MSLDRQTERNQSKQTLWSAGCDVCGFVEQYWCNDFQHLRQQIKFEGWTVEPVKTPGVLEPEWINKCPDCSVEKHNYSAFIRSVRTSITLDDLSHNTQEVLHK